MPPKPETLPAVTLPVRQLAEFLLRGGSIDDRFGGFDRANEGARLHRLLQKQAKREYADYQAEVALRETLVCAGVEYTVEGRADGIFTAADGVTVIDEIKTTTLPPEHITADHAPEHWGQGQLYAAIYAEQQGLAAVRVQLCYYQTDEEQLYTFTRDCTAADLRAFLTGLLTEYAPWAKRAAAERAARSASLAALTFPFDAYRPGQRAMAAKVYETCMQGGQLLCQAPTGIGKTMSVLFPALKALGAGVAGPVFYLTARGTTRAAAEDALALLRGSAPDLRLRSLSLTAKEKICPCAGSECSPDGCPYANGYYDRLRPALWAALDTPALTAAALRAVAEQYTVCPFELGLELSLWSDVIIGDYNYLFDPVVRLQRFFERRGDYLFLVDEAHNLPERARDMHSASLRKGDFAAAKKCLGKGKSRLHRALGRVNDCFLEWRHRCAEGAGDDRFGRVLFRPQRDEVFDTALQRLCEPLQQWLEEHRVPDEAHAILLQLYFDVREWLRVADGFDEHYTLQAAVYGREVCLTQLCLDPSAFLAADFARGRAAVLYSATLGPAGYYKDICGVPQAAAVALRSPFPPQNLGLFCACDVSTRYKDRAQSADRVAGYLAALASARPGNYLAFFPSYRYLEDIWQRFTALYPDLPTLKQESGLDEAGRAAFLAHFAPQPQGTLLGFAVLGGVFGEGVDLAGERLIGVAVVGPGLPQVNARQEQLRTYFEATRGAGFDYAYRYPGMNKVLQAAGRLIRTPQDRGAVLLLDDRFSAPAYRALMPPHWSHLQSVTSIDALQQKLQDFWQTD